MAPMSDRGEISSLTGLRGVAATLVMVDHLAQVDFSASFPLSMLPHMYLAVDMFMILSGFILAMTYERRLGRLTAGQGYRLFVVRRLARLWPLYVLTTLVCFALCRAGLLTFLHPDTSVAALVANLLGVQSWAWPGSSLNGPGWSISTEWLANLMFPALLPVILGRSPRLSAAAAGLGLAAVIYAAIRFGQLFDVPSPGAINTITGLGAVTRCVGEFVIGIYGWRLRSRVQATRILGGNGWQFGILLLLPLLLLDPRLDVLSVMGCALLVLGLSYETSAVSTTLRSAPLMHLGRISYSIYLVHVTLMPLRDMLASLFGEYGVPIAWLLAVLCCVAVAVVLATLTRRYIEQPAQRALLRIFDAQDRNRIAAVAGPAAAGGSTPTRSDRWPETAAATSVRREDYS